MRLKKFTPSSQISLIVSEIIIGFVLIVLVLGLFLSLGEDVWNKEVISFDSTIIHAIYTLRNPTTTILMNIFSFLGGEILLGFAIIVTCLFLIKKDRRDAFIFGFILFFGIGLNLFLKDVFQRPRPHFMPLVQETSYSFPSGHAMNSFVFYTALSYFVFWKMKNKILGRILIGCSGTLILLIGLSRIYLGAHYPSDVIAGYAAGFCWFLIVLVVDKTLTVFKLLKEKTE